MSKLRKYQYGEDSQYADTSIFDILADYASKRSQEDSTPDTEDPQQTQDPTEDPEYVQNLLSELQSKYEDLQNQMQEIQNRSTFGDYNGDDGFLDFLFDSSNAPITPSQLSNFSREAEQSFIDRLYNIEGVTTGQPTNLNSSAVGRGQMIKATRERMYKKLGYTDIKSAEQAYRTDPNFEAQVIGAYRDELDSKIPLDIQGPERERRIAKGWYTGDVNYPDDKVPHPEAGNRITAGQYADRMVGKRQNGGYGVADTEDKKYIGLNDPSFDKMYFPMEGKNLFRGLDNGQPVHLRDSKGKYVVLNGPKDTEYMSGDVYESRYQNGGSTDASVQWNIDWLNSPMAHKMNAGETDYTQQRIDSINSLNGILPTNPKDMSKISGRRKGNLGVYDKANHNIRYNNTIKDLKLLDLVKSHEISHSADRGGDFMSPQDSVLTDSEGRALLNQARRQYQIDGVYDPFTQEFKPEFLNNKNDGIRNLRKKYTDKEITDLMNSVSSTKAKDLPIAQDGRINRDIYLTPPPKYKDSNFKRVLKSGNDRAGIDLKTVNNNPPIYTTDKNDPRLRAYNDSLNLYNYGVRIKGIMDKAPVDRVGKVKSNYGQPEGATNPNMWVHYPITGYDNTLQIVVPSSYKSNFIGKVLSDQELQEIKLGKAPQELTTTPNYDFEDYPINFNFYKNKPAVFEYSSGGLYKSRNTKSINGTVTYDSGWKIDKDTRQVNSIDLFNTANRYYATPNYKKPVQPIIYKPEENKLSTKRIPANLINSAGDISNSIIPNIGSVEVPNLPDLPYRVEYDGINHQNFINEEASRNFIEELKKRPQGIPFGVRGYYIQKNNK